MDKVGRKILDKIIDNIEVILFVLLCMFGVTFCFVFLCCLVGEGGLFYAVFQAILHGIAIELFFICVVVVLVSSSAFTDIAVDRIKKWRYEKWMTK